MRHYILCVSVTYAMRAQKELLGQGIVADIVRTPAGIRNRDCSYALMVSRASIGQAAAIINKSRVRCSHVYSQQPDGSFKEVIMP